MLLGAVLLLRCISQLVSSSGLGPACPLLPPRAFGCCGACPVQAGSVLSRDRRRAQAPPDSLHGTWWPDCCVLGKRLPSPASVSSGVKGMRARTVPPLSPASFSHPATTHVAACTFPSVLQSPPLLFTH